MLKSEEYRQEAAECLKLARKIEKFDVKKALIEMAADYTQTADKLEGKHKQAA